MNGRGNWGDGPYADDEYRADSDFVYPSESGQQWQPGWDLGRRADGEDNGQGYAGQGYGGQGYSGQGYAGQGHGGQAGYDSYSPDSYSQGGYADQADSYGYSDSYDQPGHGGNGHSSNGYSPNGYASAEYGSADYGTAAYDSPGYQRADYGDPGYGREGYGSDTYSGGDGHAGNGYQAESSGSADSGWFDRPDTGSFGRPDTGSFGRPDTGSFGRPDDYQSGGYPNGAQPADGHDQWRYGANDADDDGQGHWDADDQDDEQEDWQDDRESGLLSRRFGADDDDEGRRGGRRAGRIKRKRRGRGRAAITVSMVVIVVIALVVVAGGVFGYRAYQNWHTGRYGDYAGAGTGSVNILVPEGASLAQLGPILKKKGVIMEIRPYDTAAGAASNADHLQPGVYQLHHHMSSAIAVSYLLNTAHRTKDQVTIIEGTRAANIAAALSKQTGKPVSDFTQIIQHPPALLGLPSWAPKGVSAEGFLFPDTYTLLPKMSPLQILQMMVKEFNAKVDSIDLTGAAQKGFTTPWHALIVASMIQAEAGNVSDFKKISRVAWNRIKDHMKLQFDSTIFYALGIGGTAANAQQLKTKSPYNTYAHTGLPPGPIGSPGLLAIQAAVHPAEGADKDLLYFITDTRQKPYVTHFTALFSQFQQWQQEFKN